MQSFHLGFVLKVHGSNFTHFWGFFLEEESKEIQDLIVSDVVCIVYEFKGVGAFVGMFISLEGTEECAGAFNLAPCAVARLRFIWMRGKTLI